MRKFDAAGVDEIEIGDCKILKIEGRSIGIYYDGKKYFAIRNVCPHEQAELCKGKITGTTLPSKPHEYIYGMEGEVLVCPWHGWEFNVNDGTCLGDPKYKVKTYEVSVENNRVMVQI
jgi:nitrite reductase/ring-hydroxylating ferredoxin subunit